MLVDLKRDAGAVVLKVADEGPGLPREIVSHLFEPGRSSRPGGTGLGLAISQLLSRQLGGELILAATGAGGTTFRLSVPAEPN